MLQSYLEQFRALAADNDANAQFILGCCYEGDQAAASAWTEALQFYTRASEQGHPTALLRLGCMHAKGLGVKSNVTQAKLHYERALARGQPLAEHGPLYP
jgi:TPR repeat protein